MYISVLYKVSPRSAHCFRPQTVLARMTSHHQEEIDVRGEALKHPLDGECFQKSRKITKKRTTPDNMEPIKSPGHGHKTTKRTSRSPAIVLVLRGDLPVRKLGPELGFPLAQCLSLTVPPLSDPGMLFLEQDAQGSVRGPQPINLASSAMVVVDSVWTSVDPSLGNVN